MTDDLQKKLSNYSKAYLVAGFEKLSRDFVEPRRRSRKLWKSHESRVLDSRTHEVSRDENGRV